MHAEVFLPRTSPWPHRACFRVGGMMPVGSRRKDDGRLVPAVAEAGWRGVGAIGPNRRKATRRAWTATDPLPPALLIGAVLLLDVLLVAGVGLRFPNCPIFAGRPAPALVALATLICAAVAGALGAYGHRGAVRQPARLRAPRRRPGHGHRRPGTRGACLRLGRSASARTIAALVRGRLAPAPGRADRRLPRAPRHRRPHPPARGAGGRRAASRALRGRHAGAPGPQPPHPRPGG